MGAIYLGDIHGNFDFISWYVKAHKIKNTSIIQVGDFGIGFKKANGETDPSEELKLDKLNRVLDKFNVNLFAIRGNHDNPAYFDGSYKNYDRINLMPDYSVLEIENKNHLFVGGAISIDRIYRTENIDFWKDEVFVFDEQKTREIKNVDVLVTHNSMSFLFPLWVDSNVLNFAKSDPGLLERVTDERLQMTKMWDILTKENENQIELHVYGHFHQNHTIFIDNTKHVLLSINKTYEHPY